MSRGRTLLIVVGGLLGLLVAFRIVLLSDILVRQMAVTVPGDARTPTDVGLPFEDASFEVGGDRLVAWYVEPADARPLAFLLLHGDGETVSDFLAVQRLLYDRGYASLVYDYGGYGDSEGRPSTRIFDAEPRAALQALIARIDDGHRVVVLGHSFGAAIAVEAFHDHAETRLHSVVFNSGPPALRDILNEVLGVPSLITALLPNVINAKVNAGDFDIPMLVIGSQADEVMSPQMVRRVYEGATEPKHLLMFTASDHNYLTQADPAWWSSIFGWIEGL